MYSLETRPNLDVVKLKSVGEDLLLSVERGEWGKLCLSGVLDTKQAPQSWIGRFNKVIGGVYQGTTVVGKWVGFRQKKGVEKVMDESGNWIEVGGDRVVLRVMSDEEWRVPMSDESWDVECEHKCFNGELNTGSSDGGL